MDLLLLLVILAIFLLPSFFMMRAQKKRQQEVSAMQASIQPGDRIVTVSGFHGSVVATREAELDLELAPGTVVTMERAGVMRKVDEVSTPYNEVPGSAGHEWNQSAHPAQDGNGFQHPENNPEGFNDNPGDNPRSQ